MSWSDTFRDRHYEPGYVYIAGSLSGRVLKIGTTINIRGQEKRLQRDRYGGIDDWILLYYVWVEERGKTEHDARRRLRRYQDLRMYDKEGHRQKGREIVGCRFGIALEALGELLDERQRSGAWHSKRSGEFEFGWTPPEPDPPPYVPPPPPVGIPSVIHLLRNVEQFELSIRSSNCLRNDNIRYIGELVQRSEAEMLRTPFFGRKALNEIKGARVLRLLCSYPLGAILSPLRPMSSLQTMPYPLVIFDLDGTLADSLPWFLCNVNGVADKFSFRRVAEEDIEVLRGLGSREILGRLEVPLWKLPGIARHLRRLKSEHLASIALFQGVDAMLRALADGGVRMALVSSDNEANARRQLGEAAALFSWFDCGASLFGKAAKFRRILKRSGVGAAQAIAIGDEVRDIEAARAAGIACGAVTWGYAAPEALQALGPDLVFERMEDIAGSLTARDRLARGTG